MTFARVGDCQEAQLLESQMQLHGAASLPVAGHRTENPENIRLIANRTRGSQQVRGLVDDHPVRRDQSRNNRARIRGVRHVAERDPGSAARQRHRIVQHGLGKLGEGRRRGAALRQPLLVQMVDDLVGVDAVVVDAGVGIPQIERRALVDGPDLGHAPACLRLRASTPSSFTNRPRSAVASSSRTGRKRHRRSRTGPGRASRGVPPLLGSAMPVVPEEAVPVVRGVEVSLDRPEPPRPRSPSLSLSLSDSALSPARSLPSNRGCCLILRHTLNAARLGTCGKAADFDQRRNSATGTSSGPARRTSR